MRRGRKGRTLKPSKSFDDMEGPLWPPSALHSSGANLNIHPPPPERTRLDNVLHGRPKVKRNVSLPMARCSAASSLDVVAIVQDELSSSSHNLRSTLRRNSLSNDSDHRRNDALQAVNEYRACAALDDGAINMEGLKECFSTSNKKNRRPKPRRRASLSSFHSSSQSSLCAGELGTTPAAVAKSTGSSAMSNYSVSDDNVDFSDTADGAQHHLHHHNHQREYNNSMSTSTLPIGNVVKTEREKKRKHQIKTDQIIESLVWFSFHIPRTVLEDLIAHELELWKRNNINRISRRNMSSSRRKSKTLFKNESSGSMNTPTNGDESDGSVSSLSDEGASSDIFGASYSEKLIRREQGGHNNNDMIRLPKAFERESAILFVDMSGFTKLSTMLDVESLSKVINSYFDMIVSEVILFGGDILKFAGDAFFAEWRVMEDTDAATTDDDQASNPLSELNASLVSINEMAWDDNDIPPLSNCVMMAAKCATSIVKKFSDYHVTTADSRNTNEAMLNVHCGVGVGHMVGLHVRDYKEGQEEEAVELRREFLILGEPIDQVS
jgi:class 3 adenylate cyclase